MPFASVPDLIAALAAGRMVVLVDDEDRENEGDLVMAADQVTEAAIAYMATRGCGLICLAMDGSLLDRLGLPVLARDPRHRYGTAFTLSIEAARGVTTGISAADRSTTIHAAIAADAGPQDVVSPGHIFPLRAREGGCLVRAGHTEAGVDLARLAGRRPAAVICEIMRPDGRMARLPDLERFCAVEGLLLGSIADLIAHRERSECLVEVVAEAPVTIAGRACRAFGYRNRLNGAEHLAVVGGKRLGPGAQLDEPVWVRVHRDDPLADLYAAGPASPLRVALERVLSGDGVLLHLRDGAGVPLAQRLRALAGGPAPVHDVRDYGIGAQILRHLGVRQMRLLTSANVPPSALAGHGLEILEVVAPLLQHTNP